jgi:hypothetical protein
MSDEITIPTLLGGFGELPKRGPYTLEHIEKAISEFRLTGAGGLGVHGSFLTGYNLFFLPEGSVGGGSAGGGGGGGGTPTGACCVGSACSITTAASCSSMGGTYHGNGVPCSPNPCAPTGACCLGTSCSAQTQTDCVSSGGTYHGDNSPCAAHICDAPPGHGCDYWTTLDEGEHDNIGNCQTDWDFHSEGWASTGPVFQSGGGSSLCTDSITGCTITGTFTVPGGWSYVHSPPGCSCTCASCNCACGPTDCCFFDNPTTITWDCGYGPGHLCTCTSHITGADCTNGTGSGYNDTCQTFLCT